MQSHYDPASARFLSFAKARSRFIAGASTPRDFLEECLRGIDAREAEIKAFVKLDVDAARTAADAASERWRRGQPISSMDGLPIGIKDCFDVRGWPTEVNSALFRNHTADLDAAHVYALRQGGAILLGKTTTTELTMALPPPTWNPWDLRRTPGGSSSGSAAAVAARMLPVATGSQVRGSTLRPASICGIVGMKPTFGALNRHGGVDPSPSLNHLGLLAGTLTDAWEVARFIGQHAGGDPGFKALTGPASLPPPRKPRRLARQYTAGWPKTDAASQEIFARWAGRLGELGVEILEPESDPALDRYELMTARTPEFFFDLMTYELRWPLGALVEQCPDSVSDIVAGYVNQARKMSPDQYAVARDRREELRQMHRALAGKVDGFITLAHIGAGQTGQPKSGTPWYNDASSAIGAPTYSLPLLTVEGLPLGVQIMGFEGRDDELTAIAAWLLNEFAPQLI